MEVHSTQKNFLYIPCIKTVTYENKSIKFHCTELWNEISKYGIVIRKDIQNI